MIRNPFSEFASSQRAKAAAGAVRRNRTRDAWTTPAAATVVAIFVTAAIALLAVGCAEEVVEPEAARTPEANSEAHIVRQVPPRAEPPLDGAAFRLQRKQDWWENAREQLFADIDLSEEQLRAVDAILEAQLNARVQLQQLDAKFTAARKTRDAARIKAARDEFRAFKDQIKEPHEIYEEMRAVLAEAQRPAFDMNRARHVAAMQGSAGNRSVQTPE